MIFPIGDDQVYGGYKPLFSYAFIVFNVLIFLWQVTMPEAQANGFIYTFGTSQQSGGKEKAKNPILVV